MYRRYLSDFRLKDIVEDSYDVVIVGTGIAGLYTALNIDKKYKVLIISKDRIEENNSNLAQGGIAACIRPEDKNELHIEDTLVAGSGYNKIKSVEILVEEAKENIYRLIDYGTNFDRDDNGKLLVTREGGHSQRRILHAKDTTGKEIIRALRQEVSKRNNIGVLSQSFVLDILDYKDKCIGVLVKTQGTLNAYLSKATILATGGIGQIYKNTTNSRVATGDGIGIAYRSGVDIIDMEFVQFHPTALYNPDRSNRFLISEAVRGEGAILRNSKGEAFMENYHELKDLAPRDIVAKAIFEQMSKDESECVFLDITHKEEEFIKSRFPNIFKKCLENGIDMTKEYIPISPVQHYIMGGIKVDDCCKTSMDGLYACGEVACTGVHGANRLASNSLLEGIVFGNRLANELNNRLIKENDVCDHSISNTNKGIMIDDSEISEIMIQIKEIMNKSAFIVRNNNNLEEGLKLIKEFIVKLNKCYSDEIKYYECVNIALTGYLILKSALSRKGSLGSHVLIN